MKKDADLIEDRLKELDTDSQREQLKQHFKASLKAWVYFSVCFLEEHDKRSETDAEEKVQKMLDSCKGKKKKKPGKKRQATEGKEGFEDEAEENEVINIEKLLAGLMRLAEKRIGCIWKEQFDEESYLKLYVRIVFAMIEKKEVLQNSDYRQILKLTLKNAVQTSRIDKRGLFQLISGKMVHILYTIVRPAYNF